MQKHKMNALRWRNVSQCESSVVMLSKHPVEKVAVECGFCPKVSRRRQTFNLFYRKNAALIRAARVV